MNLRKLSEYFSLIPLSLPPKNPKAPMRRNWTKHCVTGTEKEGIEKLIHHNEIGGKIGVCCGYDNLQVIDIDNHFGDADKLYAFVQDNTTELPEMPVIGTKGGGFHIYFKCEEIEGNKKLASRINKDKKPETLIETRAKGGQVVYYDNVILGDIFKVPTITPEQRNQLLTVCISLNEVAKKEKKDTKPKVYTGKQPGDVYINDISTIADTKELLRSNGWKSENETHWTRPGKESGCSATFGIVGKNKFYVFSSNAQPFEDNQSYSMMGVRTMLLHNGNYSHCAKELAQKYNIKIEEPKIIKKSAQKWKILNDIIKDWKLDFRYNEITRIIDYRKAKGKYQQLGVLMGNLFMEFEVNRGVEISTRKIEQMIENDTICTVFNPVKDFFKSLPKWDGKDNIKALTDCITLGDGENRDYFHSMFKKHLIRTIRCGLEPNDINRIVLTFHGPQDIGKTKLFQWLFLANQELYYGNKINIKNKDSWQALTKYLCINLDDIEDTNEREKGQLKSFVSQGTVTDRPAYGHFDIQSFRIASFVASTNKLGILTDDNNTRWVILKVKSFDWEKYTEELSQAQIWSQAYHLYKQNNTSGELTKSEELTRDFRNNKTFLSETPEREILQSHFRVDENNKLRATDVKLLIEKAKHPIRVNFKVLSNELHRLFGEPVHTTFGGKNGKFYSIIGDFSDVVRRLAVEAVEETAEVPF